MINPFRYVSWLVSKSQLTGSSSESMSSSRLTAIAKSHRTWKCYNGLSLWLIWRVKSDTQKVWVFLIWGLSFWETQRVWDFWVSGSESTLQAQMALKANCTESHTVGKQFLFCLKNANQVNLRSIFKRDCSGLPMMLARSMLHSYAFFVAFITTEFPLKERLLAV